MSDTSLRGFYKLGKNELVYFINKAFGETVWLNRSYGSVRNMEKKIWIIAELSKEHRNEIKKQQMYELKWYLLKRSQVLV